MKKIFTIWGGLFVFPIIAIFAVGIFFMQKAEAVGYSTGDILIN